MAKCIKCDTVLKASYKVCPECGTLSGPTRCVHCNAELEQDFKFCPYCTKPVKQPETAVKATSTNKETVVSNFSISAYHHFVKGNNEQAIAVFTKAIEFDPNHLDAYLFRGNVYNALERYEEAIADFTKTIELDPIHGESYLQRGVAQYRLGNHEEAIADYTKTIELDPKQNIYGNTYHARFIVHDILGNTEEADQDFENSERWDNGQDPI